MTYIYDGSFEGMLTCIFESFSRKEVPDFVTANRSNVQLSLFGEVEIETNPEKAQRVRRGICTKVSKEAFSLISHVFLSCSEQKEELILQFVRLAMDQGKKVLRQLSHPVVAPMLKVQKSVRNEAHLFKEFLRFSDCSGILVARIEPKNMILPLLADHFSIRLRNERFMIFDAVHGGALLYAEGKNEFVDMNEADWADADEQERDFQSLWKLYYDTIAVEGRENPKLRMSHMPKRYWANMTEFLLDTAEDGPGAAPVSGLARAEISRCAGRSEDRNAGTFRK